jgi:hypothetical protein
VFVVVSCDKTVVKGRASYEVDGQVSIEIWDELAIFGVFFDVGGY